MSYVGLINSWGRTYQTNLMSTNEFLCRHRHSIQGWVDGWMARMDERAQMDGSARMDERETCMERWTTQQDDQMGRWADNKLCLQDSYQFVDEKS